MQDMPEEGLEEIKLCDFALGTRNSTSNYKTLDDDVFNRLTNVS